MPILYIRDELNENWLPVVSELGAIPNVVFPDGVTNGQALIYHSGSGVWTAGSVAGGSGSGGGGVASYMDDLLDVNATNPNDNDILVYNTSNSKWEAVAQSFPQHVHYGLYYSIDDLAESSGSGEVHWDNVTNKPSTYTPSTHTHVEADITDLVHDAVMLDGRDLDLLGTPLDGQSIVWRATADKWMYEYTTGSGAQGSSGSGGAIPVFGEDITSQIANPGDHYDTSYVFISGLLEVFYNGVRQQASKITEDGDKAGFTTTFTAVAGDTLVINYFRQADALPADTIGIKEEDESPALSGIHTIIVGNGDLEDLGGGYARLLTAHDTPATASADDVIKIQIFT